VRRRRTLAEGIAFTGIGLHSGKPSRATLRPAEPGCGIVFLRREAGRVVEIPARIEYLVSTRSATVLGRDEVRVATVEHLLAALSGLGVDDTRVHMEGEELPALDGGCGVFVSGLREAGLREHGPSVEPLRPARVLELRQGLARVRVRPAEGLGVVYEVDFDHARVGRQRIELDPLTPADFERELAAARTFGFLRDAAALRAAGLAGGASLENTLVYTDDGVLNPGGPRWADEPVRHKLLDLVGDLALLGRPLSARVEVERGGHTLHAALVAALLAL